MEKMGKEELKKLISSRIRELNSKCGLSGRKLARAIGVPYNTLVFVLRGERLPGVETARVIADYYAVPLDYLLGRCDEDTARAILNSFPECFMELRKAAYEDYVGVQRIIAPNETKGKPGKRDLPFPYNILALVDPEFEGGKMSDDYIDRLWDAWVKQKPRYAEFLEAYYESGYTLNDIASKYGISKQRAHQMVVNGVKALRALYALEPVPEKTRKKIGRNKEKC